MKAEIEFKQYKRKGLSEMIPFKEFVGQDMSTVSVSEQDKLLSNEEFEQGYIARNPKNHADMWYVAKKYFDDNLEPVSEDNTALSSHVKQELLRLLGELHNMEIDIRPHEVWKLPSAIDVNSLKFRFYAAFLDGAKWLRDELMKRINEK